MDKKRQKRKRKNARFMDNARGFAKQGIFGRGTKIEDEQFTYFINILDAMKSGFEDMEEKVIMANNTFEQTIDLEIHLASNQVVSKALEALIGFVDAQNLERFFNKFADNFRPICSDRFASHVLQKMVEIAFLRAVGDQNSFEDNDIAPLAAKRTKLDNFNEEEYNLNTEFTLEHKKNCADFVLRTGKFILNNLEDFVWDTCANHIMRTCILSLAGVHVMKIAFEKGGADMAKNRKLYKVPDEWIEIMKEFPDRLEMWPQFAEFPYQEHSSALLGVICIALRTVDKKKLKHFGRKILMDAFLKSSDDDIDGKKEEEKIVDIPVDADADADADDDNKETNDKNPEEKKSVAKVFQYQTSVILLETLLSLAGNKLLTQLYCMLFAGRISLLARDHLTNFAVQKLLNHIKSKKDFENIVTELIDALEELLKIGHTGVVSALTATCLRLCSKQAQIVTSLQLALHVDKEKSKHFFQCLIKLKPYEIVITEKEQQSHFVHLHGSLIIQNILQFNKPIFLVNCILESSSDYLAQIFNTPNGSHIVDAFLQSKFIGEKSREKLIRYLENYYIDLAITKHGSRVVEQLFAAAQEGQKSRIVKALADKNNMLKGSPFGRLLNSKFRVDTYRLSAAQWKASIDCQKKEGKVQKLFNEIIN